MVGQFSGPVFRLDGFQKPIDIDILGLVLNVIEDRKSPNKMRFDELSAKKNQRLKERLRILRNEKRIKPVESSAVTDPRPKPRYDEVFEQGVEWLDELASPTRAEGDFAAEVSDDAGDSPAREGRDAP